MKCKGRIVIMVLTVMALGIALYAGSEAQARSSFFTGRGCSSCHVAPATATCNGCHHHGAVSLRGTTNKTSYAPGETVSVTINGGEESGWVSVILYDQNNVQIARSSGNASGMGHSATFPAVLTAPAPTTAGTYRWKAAWHGNSNNSGSTHGDVTVNTNSFTVTAPADTTPPTLSISTPSNGLQTNNSLLNISGTTSDASGIKSLTINGNAVTVNAGGSFSFDLPLTKGVNSIITIATDTLNNQTTDTRSVTLVAATSPIDFDGDGKDDIAVWRPTTGEWLIRYSSDGIQHVTVFGITGDKQVPGDYDGDKKSDIAVWRPTEGKFYITESATGLQRSVHWGANGDIPVPGDYDGDTKTDTAVWRPIDGKFYIIDSSTNTERSARWGINTDTPVPGDYDGDGKTDLAVWRSTEGKWYIINSSTNNQRSVFWGSNGDIPIPSDFDGDGKTDIAVWRPTEGKVYIVDSSTGAQRSAQWGNNGDVPVPGDYDNLSRTEIAVWRPASATWFILDPLTNMQRSLQWGIESDKPLSLQQTIQ